MQNAENKNITVFVAMSGGVDSSVAAALLKQRGYEVVGVHLKCYNIDGCAEQDAEDARRAAETLRIPFYVLDLEEEYKRRVVRYMVEGYRRGLTPNPDVMCNREVKFGLFFRRALEMGADYVATGHYVRLETRKQEPGIREGRRRKRVLIPRYRLLVARDQNKDQSYFLWTLTQEQLRHCLFPIGEYKKPEVREIARRCGLPNAEKKDSQGICFLGNVALPEFLKQYIPERKGRVIGSDGGTLGEHRGAHLYTIGQRHAIGVSGSVPHYVAAKDVGRNVLFAVPAGDPALSKNEAALHDVSFVSGAAPASKHFRCFVRVRYRQPPAAAVCAHYDVREKRMALVFVRPQQFVAEGQSAVFYTARGEMIGGGVIGRS